MAVLAAVVAAIVASVVWYLLVAQMGFQLGLLAPVVDVIVAKAAIMGAGNRSGPRVQVMGVGATILATVASDALIVRHFVSERLVADGLPALPILLPPPEMIELVIEIWLHDPMALLVWRIALFVRSRSNRQRTR